MRRQIRRFLVVLAGATGIVALLSNVAYARIGSNHCEPLR
jgi:hypothetical protein